MRLYALIKIVTVLCPYTHTLYVRSFVVNPKALHYCEPRGRRAGPALVGVEPCAALRPP